MTDLMVKMYVRGKILDFLRKSILGLEITEKAKTGVEKMETLLAAEKAGQPLLEELAENSRFFVKRSHWIFGGDGQPDAERR